MITVAQIGKVYVKASQFLHPERVDVLSTGIRYDREFALVEDDGKFVSSDKHGDFFPLKFSFDGEQLRLDFPAGQTVGGPAVGHAIRDHVDDAGRCPAAITNGRGPAPTGFKNRAKFSH